MQLRDGGIVYSATDLVSHSACSHATALSIAFTLDLVDIEPAEAQGMAKLAGKRGDEHEVKVLELMRSQGHQVTDFTSLAHGTRTELLSSAAQTSEALERGDDIVYQGIFFDGTFLGYPDFLIRINDERYKRGFTYEVWDAKLKRSLSANAVLQMAAYSRQLEKLGFEHADQMHAYLGDMTIADFYVADALPYAEKLSQEFEAQLLVKATVPAPIWSSKITACEMCKWSVVCETGREQVRDLSLVAKLTGSQRKKLMSSGINTLEDLADANDDQAPKRMASSTFERLRHQAKLQSIQDNDPQQRVIFETFSDEGFSLLPIQNAGDVWFDMEGDPFALAPNGLEYLFGAITLNSELPEFTPFWAHTNNGEKIAFENFVDWVNNRRKVWPEMHVYHYASYERTRMVNLAARHATREVEINDWLRNDVLVDLLKVVQRSVRVSQRSYSIKKLEPLYGFEREPGVQTAGDSVVDYEDYLELMDKGKSTEAQAKLDGIEKYNKDDCISTLQLDRWLRDISKDRNISPVPTEPAEPKEIETPEQCALREALTAGIPTDPALRSPEDQAKVLLAAALGFHAREDRAYWGDYFRHVEASPDEWVDDDKVAIVKSVKSSGWIEPTGRQRVKRREVTMVIEGGEGLKFGKSSNLQAIFNTCPVGATQLGTRYTDSVSVSRLSSGEYFFSQNIKESDPSWDALPIALIEGKPAETDVLVAGVIEAAKLAVSTLPEFPFGPAFDLLARRQPGKGLIELRETGQLKEDIVASLLKLENSYLAIQGPPGTGKTYITARIIKDLVENHNWRIGVVAQSHKVIENMLRAVVDSGLDSKRIAKQKTPGSTATWQTPTNVVDWLNSNDGGVLVGGTQFVFRRPTVVELEPFHLLVIEEAGQFSLANTISVATITKRLLLVGDPQQLPQVSQGSHPEPVDESSLSWLLNKREIIDRKFGYFLPLTYRMVSALCDPVSKLSYRGRLKSADKAGQRYLADSAPGLQVIPIHHEQNDTFSIEEAIEVVKIAQSLIGRDWADEGVTRPLIEQDIKVVAPFNAQVNLITRLLDECDLSQVLVGTVDRFQGQEAPVVVMSLTTSSPEESARGLDFVISRNRLNVGISRAQWATYLLYSPALVNVEAKTPEEIRLVSGLLSLVT